MTMAASVSGIWAIVPIKRLDHSKRRLSDMLDPLERCELAWAMVRDVLDTLSVVQSLGGILVVTNDPQAAGYARARGAVTLADTREAGTNEAVRAGMAWLMERGAAGAIVVPGDIPFAGEDEFSMVLAKLGAHPVVLVPAARDGGTNVLAIAPLGAIAVAYGENSFARHLEAAQQAGIGAHVLRLEGAGHDIDVSGDLFIDAGQGRAVRTRTWLKRIARPTPAAPGTELCKEIFQ
jgi:2-phospho-L-lactate guanylyltransferase